MGLFSWLTRGGTVDLERSEEVARSFETYLSTQLRLLQTALQTDDEDGVVKEGIDAAHDHIKQREKSDRLADLFEAKQGYIEQDFAKFTKTLGAARGYIYGETDKDSRRAELEEAVRLLEDLLTMINGVLDAPVRDDAESE
jgi:hypothetical protein